MSRLAVLIPMGLMAATAIYVASDEPTRAVFFNYDGDIAQGTAFGVTVGSSRGAARAILERRFRHVGTAKGGLCVTVQIYSGEYSIDRYADETWKRGVICVVSSGERVTAMQWYYDPLGAVVFP